MKNISFIIGIEKNDDIQLEQMAILLCRSIRKFGGIYKDAPIYSLQPTSRDIDASTLVELKKLGVIHRKEVINTEFTKGGYGFYNMPYVCDYFAQTLKEDYLIWLDIDVLCLNSPIFKVNTDDVVCDTYDKAIMGKGYADYVAIDESSFILTNFKKFGFSAPKKICCTWFQMLGKQNFYLWSEWRKKFESIMLTFRDEGIDTTSSDMCCVEELSYSMVLEENGINPVKVNDAHPHLGSFTGLTLPFDKNTMFFHYDGFRGTGEGNPPVDNLGYDGSEEYFHLIFTRDIERKKKLWVYINIQEIGVHRNKSQLDAYIKSY